MPDEQTQIATTPPDEKKRILDMITECREMAEEITKFANKHLREIQTEIQRLQQQYDKITQQKQ